MVRMKVAFNCFTTRPAVLAVIASYVAKHPESPGRLLKFGASISWLSRLLSGLDLVWRRVTRCPTKIIRDEAALSELFCLRVAHICKRRGVTSLAMVINMDHTSMQLIPGNIYTYAPKGANQVDAAGATDKRTFTLVLASSLSGTDDGLLPFQLIQQGSTDSCLGREPDAMAARTAAEAAKCDLTYSLNHWATWALPGTPCVGRDGMSSQERSGGWGAGGLAYTFSHFKFPYCTPPLFP
jgi:hypothetical protein